MSPASSELLTGCSQIAIKLLAQLHHLVWPPQAPLWGAMKAGWRRVSPLRDGRVSFPRNVTLWTEAERWFQASRCQFL